VDAVFHHGHAKGAADCQDVCTSSERLTRAFLIDSFVRRLVYKTHPTTTAAAKAFLFTSCHFNRCFTGDLHELSGSVVDIILPAQVTGIVKGHAFFRRCDWLELSFAYQA